MRRTTLDTRVITPRALDWTLMLCLRQSFAAGDHVGVKFVAKKQKKRKSESGLNEQEADLK